MKPSTPLRGLLALLALTPTFLAAPQSLERKLEAKLKKPFVSYGGWESDYNAARARARKEGKVLFVYFSRSYSP